MKTMILYTMLLWFMGIGGNALSAKPIEVDGLFYVTSGANTVDIVGSNREEAVLEIPSEVAIKGTNYKVTGVENFLLEVSKSGTIKQYGWGQALKKVVIPHTVKRIGLSAFAHQSLLESVELPASVQSIGGMAFSQCSSLQQIRLPEGVTIVAAFTFSGCKNLREIILPESLQKIYIGAFQHCTSLTDIRIPERVDEIDMSAFEHCGIWALDLSATRIKKLDLDGASKTALGYLSFPKGVAQFTGNRHASDKCMYDMDYATLEALARNGQMNFLNSIRYLAVRSSEDIEKIYCPALEALILSGSTKGIGRWAVRDKPHLKRVYLNGFQFQDPKSGKQFRIAPSSVTRIGTGAFRNCTSLTSVKFPPTLTTIGDEAFYDCKKLGRIDFPLSLERIGECAFWNCESVQAITGLNSSISYGYFQGRTDPFLDVPHFNLRQVQKTFTYFATGYLKKELQEWERKREFETTAQWQERVTVENREKRVKEWVEQAKKAYIAQAEIPALKVTLGSYDADYNTYRLEAEGMGSVYVNVPMGEAQSFKENFGRAGFVPTYGVKDDRMALTGLTVRVNGKTYRNMEAARDDNRELIAQLPPLSIDFGQGGNTAGTPAPVAPRQAGPSDVDVNIPETGTVATTTFAVIIANENYTREARVPFAARDGEVFAQYCRKTLGIPEKNIRLVKDATLNDMKFQLNWLGEVLSAYNGSARAIVYYAGHGIPGESDRSAYLLPADGYGSNPGTGFSLKDFYAGLGSVPAESVTVFLDACFSGTKRESGMMTAARGVAIKVKDEAPKGNVVVFSAAQGDETAYQYAEKRHGMFTYFLLKKLQESRGNATLGELGSYLSAEVKKASIVTNNKIQTPTILPSPGMAGWEERTLK